MAARVGQTATGVRPPVVLFPPDCAEWKPGVRGGTENTEPPPQRGVPQRT